MMSTDSNDQWGQILLWSAQSYTPSLSHPLHVARHPHLVLPRRRRHCPNPLPQSLRRLGIPPAGRTRPASLGCLAPGCHLCPGPTKRQRDPVLWKDIPSSTSLFLFSLMILKIALTARRMAEKTPLLGLARIAGLCVASFRHNGLPIPFVLFPLLLLVYRRWWKPLLGGMVLTITYIVSYKDLFTNH